MATSEEFDLIVIGSGPGGQKAAIAAAKLGRRAVVVERSPSVGGVCLHTGTIPSKTMREAVVHLTGLMQREMYGQSYRVKDEITVQDLIARTAHVVEREAHVVRDQLVRNRVRVLNGTGRFVDPHTVAVRHRDGDERLVRGDRVVIATGTRPARPASVEFDGRTVIDSDSVIQLERIPSSLVVVGAGVVGIEYASMFAALGTKVTVVERRDRMLEFCDAEIVDALRFSLRDLGTVFRFREHVTSVDRRSGQAIASLASGKRILADVVLYSAGRQGVTEALDLPAAGLAADERGRIPVNPHFQTEVDHIYAVGDVVGFPALAATSMEQGRLAVLHAFGEPSPPLSDLVPIGIYTIPEISYVGRTEDELTAAAVPYEVGLARYRELARGQIAGDSHGMLKLLVSPDEQTLLGVHVFGAGATELVHIGQALMANGGGVGYLVNAVFNYPTLAEAYKVAGLDAANKIRALASATRD
ncbi:MAG: Si-specific NAD(P)(+) transhydrogenase [Actinomycetota bacterium]|nr:Si-specific NAD(P)(+) transhydrogenase [Actinomycetota bacterium]